MIRRWWRMLLVAVLTTGSVAGAPPAGVPAAAGSDPGSEPPRGGTLRAAVVNLSNPFADPDGFAALDPQTEISGGLVEILRCCLVRTLLSYDGRPTIEGGARPRADLAEALPEVSADGLTWTFRIRPGVHYAPPFADREVVASDFVRALHRLGRRCDACSWPTIGGFAYLYVDVIEGFAEYRDGQAEAISGLEVPDDRTLIVHVVKPIGSLGYLLSLTETAPIPPSPDDPAALLGVATGHDAGYGPYLVATGPYMFEGAEAVSFTGPPEAHVGAAGFRRGEGYSLVRNPSWDAASDPLRAAYVERIEIVKVADAAEGASMIESGTVDVLLDESPPLDALRAFRDDPARAGHFHATPADADGPALARPHRARTRIGLSRRVGQSTRDPHLCSRTCS